MSDNKELDKEKMIDDIVAMLDGSIAKGDGHVNIKVEGDGDIQKFVTAGCADNSLNPTACSVPTIILPGDDDDDM